VENSTTILRVAGIIIATGIFFCEAPPPPRIIDGFYTVVSKRNCRAFECYWDYFTCNRMAIVFVCHFLSEKIKKVIQKIKL